MSILARQKHRKGFLWQLVTALTLLFLVPFSMNSCSTSNYDTPITIQATSSPLISPATLNMWIASGVVNNYTGFGDKVVILDVTTSTTYAAGHIPGAQFMNNSGDLYQTRLEGPATDVNMVPNGAAMDALIRKFGIDGNTTIVFTTGGTPGASSILSATRAYFTFRYWGFPKEKLKLLDGVNFSWNAAYGLTTAPSPAPVPSTYSVKNNQRLRTDLRASLGDMIDLAEGRVPSAVAVDMRSATTGGSYAGTRFSTAGVFDGGAIAKEVAGDYVVFEGHVKGATALLYSGLFDAAANYRFKSPAALAALFNAVGIDSTKLTHVY